MVIGDWLKDIHLCEHFIDKHIELLSSESSVIDFSNVSFIEPYSLLILVIVGRLHLCRCAQRITIANVNKDVFQYLQRMNFFNIGIFDLLGDYSEVKKYNVSAYSKSIIEIFEIPAKEKESFDAIMKIIELFRKRSRFILKNRFNDRLTDLLVTVISEISQNIFEHSLDSGFFAIQTYKYAKYTNVKIVVADAGIGVEQSFKNLGNDRGSELLKKVITTPLSSKRSMGYGLCRVCEIADEIEGTVYMRSGSSSVLMLSSAKKTRPSFFLKDKLCYLDGTQIAVSLQV